MNWNGKKKSITFLALWSITSQIEHFNEDHHKNGKKYNFYNKSKYIIVRQSSYFEIFVILHDSFFKIKPCRIIYYQFLLIFFGKLVQGSKEIMKCIFSVVYEYFLFSCSNHPYLSRFHHSHSSVQITEIMLEGMGYLISASPLLLISLDSLMRN